jgi:protein gp37
MWNLWHGCHKISAGCENCYVYRSDKKHDKSSFIVTKTSSFDLPVRKNKYGIYTLQSQDYVYTCFTSDFFIEEADEWRTEAWQMIKRRLDLRFLIITKRIHRFLKCIPDDWGDGYENVTICCTTENQDRADFRLKIFKKVPIKHKMIICEPLLEEIDLSPYLSREIEMVVAGGESGENARICDYSWILKLREQCVENGVSFRFKQTGARFVKDNKLYRIKRSLQHSQAYKAGINYIFEGCPYKDN